MGKHDELVEVVNDVYRRIEESLLDVDVPDEFLDPIMSTQIKEPVFLPDTDVMMDKSVISTHLLSNKTNPFTRGELTLDMLEEYNRREDVRKRIKEFQDKFREWRSSISSNDIPDVV